MVEVHVKLQDKNTGLVEERIEWVEFEEGMDFTKPAAKAKEKNRQGGPPLRLRADGLPVGTSCSIRAISTSLTLGISRIHLAVHRLIV